jgi:hypothetical protein
MVERLAQFVDKAVGHFPHPFVPNFGTSFTYGFAGIKAGH